MHLRYGQEYLYLSSLGLKGGGSSCGGGGRQTRDGALKFGREKLGEERGGRRSPPLLYLFCP